jgi:hypothetical protein
MYVSPTLVLSSFASPAAKKNDANASYTSNSFMTPLAVSPAAPPLPILPKPRTESTDQTPSRAIIPGDDPGETPV